MATTLLQMFLGNPRSGEVCFIHWDRSSVENGKKKIPKEKKNPQRLFAQLLDLQELC